MATYTDAQRAMYASKGWALPDGSYPIPDVGALTDAIGAYGRAPANHRASLRRLIIKRARELGVPGKTPDVWQ